MRLKLASLCLALLLASLPAPLVAQEVKLPKLSESYIDTDRGIAFNYPEGWAVRSSDVGITLTYGFVQEVIVASQGDLYDDPMDFLSVLSMTMILSGTNVTPSQITEYTVNGNPAARMDLREFLYPDQYNVVFAVTIEGETFSVVGLVQTDEPEQEDVYAAILASIRIPDSSEQSITPNAEPADPSMFRTPDGQFSWQMPEGWTIAEEMRSGEWVYIITPPGFRAQDITAWTLTDFDGALLDFAAFGDLDGGLFDGMEIDWFDAGDNRAIRIDARNDASDFLDFTLYAVDLGRGSYVVLILSTRSLRDPGFEDDLLALLESATTTGGGFMTKAA
jgi:hypothetical protein